MESLNVFDRDLLDSRVSIVDDDAVTRGILGEMLSRVGYEVRAFENAEQFLLSAEKGPPDIVLLDIEMPSMNGFEACLELKKREGLSGIPVVFLSGLSDPADKVKGFSVGGVDFITKPYQIEEVRARISTHLRLARYQRALLDQNDRLMGLVDEKVREIVDSQLATIHALASLVESRDDQTGHHIMRIQEMSHYLAEKTRDRVGVAIGMEENFPSLVEWASPLHDIGKIGISDLILLKPGRLDPGEFEKIKEHTVIGARTLERVYARYPHNEYIRMGIQVARSHHERWDGKGYPDGIPGEAIPLGARIVSIVDVYDAMRSTRCYKAGLDHRTAIEEIKSGSGSHFDPRLDGIFIDNEHAFEEIFASRA